MTIHRTASFLAAAATLGVFALAGAQDTPKTLALGTAAPMKDTKMKGVDGRDVSIGSIAGAKGTLVIFSCNHCPWVKAWETRLVDLGNTYSKQGVGVIVINSNDPAAYEEDAYPAMQERAKERGMTFPYVVDATSDVARAFGATRTPEAFLFDKKGKLVYHGVIDDNAHEPENVKSRYLYDALQAVVQGKDVPLKETKAMGCGIKYRSKA